MTVAVPLLGATRPAILARPPWTGSAGAEAVELGASVGLHADEAQAFTMDVMLAVGPDGLWSCLEFGIVMGRQNGKGLPFDLAELHALMIEKETLIVHSAHRFSTALKAFKRMEQLFLNYDDLRRHVKRIRNSHGEEGIELQHPFRELQYVARERGSGRGWSAQRLFMDEAQELSIDSVADLMPTLSAQPNPMICYAGTVPKPGPKGSAFTSIRNQGREAFDANGGDSGHKGVAWLEWSSGRTLPVTYEEKLALAKNRELWAASNPALGRRIQDWFIDKEIQTFISDPELGIDAVFREIVLIWPDEISQGIITAEAWKNRTREGEAAELMDPLCIGIDMTPDRRTVGVVAAGWTYNREIGVEVIYEGSPDALVAPDEGVEPGHLETITDDFEVHTVVWDEISPISSMDERFRNADILANLTSVTTRGVVKAAGLFYDEVMLEGGRLVHNGHVTLSEQVRRAGKRPVGDSFAFDRKGSPIHLVVAATLAVAKLVEHVPPPESALEERGMTVLG